MVLDIRCEHKKIYEAIVHRDIETGASHFCRVALIPQPLLPRREKGGRIKVPLPPWERDLG